MALLVLISTLSFSIDKHYCGDTLVDFAILADAENCGMEEAENDLDSSTEVPVLTQEPCCKDVVDLVEGQDELNIEKIQVLDTDQKVFILSFAAVFSGLNLFEVQKDPPFEHYAPPVYVKDIQVLNQVFLI